MPQKKQDLLNVVLNLIPPAVAFLVPVFFLPITSEFFEYNKLALLTAATMLLAIGWGVKMLMEKKVAITKSHLDLPIFLLTVTYTLSTVFSIDKNASVFGSQGRWFPSLIGILALVVFYYAVASNVTKDTTLKWTMYAVVAGASVSSLVALLSYFGIYLGNATYFRIPNFTLTGSVVTTSILAAIAMVVAVMMMVNTSNIPERLLLAQAAVLNFVAVALVGSFPSWAVCVAGLVSTLAYLNTDKIKSSKKYLAGVFGAVLAIIVVLIIPTTKDFVVNKGYPQDIKLPVKESWLVTSSIVRDFPILGSGPSTFYLNYPRYRPLSMNGDALWNVRFDRPYNEIFGTLGSVGIVGALVVVYFIFRVIQATIFAKKSAESTDMARVVSVAMVTVITAFFFTNASVALTTMMFLFMGLSSAEAAYSQNRKYAENVLLSLASFSALTVSIGADRPDRKEVFQYIAAAMLFGLASAAGFFNYKSYMAEYYMRKSLSAIQANDGAQAYEYQRKAIQANPKRDSYHNTYAQTNLALANSLAAKENLSDEDKQTIQTLIAQAIRSSKVATEAVNPLNVLNWETRAAIYRALLGIAQDADQWAVTAYNAAVQLDPTNPRLRLDLGGIYYAQGDFLSAANLFRQATTLKSDYANAHYNFAASLVQLEDYPGAMRELEAVKSLVPEGSADYTRVVADIEGIQNLPAVAGAQDAKPTVDELENVLPEEGEELAPQEPLTNVGEEEILEPGVDLNVDSEGNVQNPETTETEEGEGGETPEQPETEETSPEEEPQPEENPEESEEEGEENN
jgi:tetratricopeptide (TPR) repeat protein